MDVQSKPARERYASLLLAIGWAVALALWSPGARAESVLCKMVCKGAGCEVKVGAEPSRVLDAKRYTTFNDCRNIEVTKPEVVVMYMRDRKWVPPPISIGAGSLAYIFVKYPPDRCSVITPECEQGLMEGGSTPAIGASPIDPRVSAPAGRGRPCALGFPCGQVSLPSDEWRFFLSDATLSGKWIVRLARGNVTAGKSEQTVARVEQGVVVADGRWFAPGSQCSYYFVDNAGRTVATGEFSLLSRGSQQDLRDIARQRVAAGSAEAIAWSDALMIGDLHWDAMQETLAEGRQP